MDLIGDRDVSVMSISKNAVTDAHRDAHRDSQAKDSLPERGMSRLVQMVQYINRNYSRYLF